MNENEALSFLGGRKFLFAMTALIFSFVLVMVGKMAVDAWIPFVEVVGAAYILGNLASAKIPNL
jgi:hypothetical protein